MGCSLETGTASGVAQHHVWRSIKTGTACRAPTKEIQSELPGKKLTRRVAFVCGFC